MNCPYSRTMLNICQYRGARFNRASQKLEVKRKSQSSRMKAIEKHFHVREICYGLYYTIS